MTPHKSGSAKSGAQSAPEDAAGSARPPFSVRHPQLTNPRNPHVKQVRLLQQRKVRDETGLFVVEGIRHVGEAVEAQAQVEYICYAPDLLQSDFAYRLLEQQMAQGRRCYALAPEVFRSLAEKENPQGILAVVRQPRTALADLHPGNFPWGVWNADAPTQIGQGEGGLPIASVCRANQIEKCIVFRYWYKLTIAKRPASRREVEGENTNFGYELI